MTWNLQQMTRSSTFDPSELDQVDARLTSRLAFAKKIEDEPEAIPKLVKLMIQEGKPHHAKKAAWILDLIYSQSAEKLHPYLMQWIQALPQLKIEAGRRVMAKIYALALAEHIEVLNDGTSRKKLISIFFDWLLDDHEVAIKANAMTALFTLGKYEDWVHPELKRVLEEDAAKHSPAYRARARMTLAKIKNEH
ncbi:hypothetical protein [Croceiramulus getboli]|nr:hypothetical protein P8624_13125 [Flavobacteriaceae bacterium YJPT1-3]